MTGESTALSHIKASKAPKAGTVIHIDGGYDVTVTGREGIFSRLRL